MELYVLKHADNWVLGIAWNRDGTPAPDLGKPDLQNLRWSFLTATDALEAAHVILGDAFAYACRAVPFADMIRASDALAVERHHARLAATTPSA